MISMTLLPQDEYRWIREEDNPSSKTFPTKKNIFPLYHQWRTYNADAPIIVNTYNTGTGKTKAALLRLLKRARDKGIANLYPSRDNVLLIAPTNELILQHVEDAKNFCKENGLPYRVMALTREELDKHLQEEYFSEADVRRSKAFHDIINDPSLSLFCTFCWHRLQNNHGYGTGSLHDCRQQGYSIARQDNTGRRRIMPDMLPETIPLSLLNALEYCPRRFHYEFVQGEMLINEFVLEGTLQHQRADTPGQHTIENDGIRTSRVHLCSEKLHLSGFADLVEEVNGLIIPVEEGIS